MLQEIIGEKIAARGTLGKKRAHLKQIWSTDSIVVTFIKGGTIRVWDVETSRGGERWYSLSDPKLCDKIQEDILHRLETWG